ncbi:MAG TPA: pilus assembly protein TadG-related protein [Amnibacterium sp.]|jgi:Flp pilus assembly protein TadG|uniref:pilus assembly protein TadG-related protein n=1 Tax=Amnibacterium sp. TaxID=1872496 RepID=UPI002F94BB76
MRKHTDAIAPAIASVLPGSVLPSDGSGRRRGRAPREDRDGGAVAVVVAVAMVALMGAAALAVDVGSLLSERGQLQNGADAAAIAIAQACAGSATATACTSPATTAQTLASSNTLAGAADVRSVTVSGGRATVTLGKTVPTSFAAALGIMSKDVTASATASWGSVASGPAVLPIAFASCVFTAKPQGTAEDLLEKGVTDTSGGCTDSHNGLLLPGGFGWLDDPSGTCNLASVVSGSSYTASSKPGRSLPSNCGTVLNQYLGKTVLLPVFDSTAGNGANGSFHIAGWAGFQLLGWGFPSTNVNTTGDSSLRIPPNRNGLIGKFLGFTTLDDAFTMGATNPGYATVVALTN